MCNTKTERESFKTCSGPKATPRRVAVVCFQHVKGQVLADVEIWGPRGAVGAATVENRVELPPN